MLYKIILICLTLRWDFPRAQLENQFSSCYFSLGQCDDKTRAEGAAAALMKYYENGNGLWSTAGWWNSANVLTSIIDYMALTGSKQYLAQVENTFEKARHHPVRIVTLIIWISYPVHWKLGDQGFHQRVHWWQRVVGSGVGQGIRPDT